MTRRQSGHTNYFGLIVGLVVSLLAIGIVWQRDWVRDSFMLLQYAPNEQIAAISERSELSDKGERYFYATHPEVNATTQFTELCANHEETSVVLGCYANGRIYLFDIDNPELDGIVEVTAAHEVLHAAYERLGSRDRQQVNDLLVAENERLSRSPEFQERMSVYDGLSEKALLDELHSVIGTEVAIISPQLEEYYGRYFDDRKAVVTLYDGYQSVFAELQAESARLADSLDRQAEAINNRVEQYESNVAALSRDIEAFNARANGGGFDTQLEFDRQRAVLVARSDALAAERVAINQAIEKYNSDKAQLDEIAGHLEELNNSIDSNLAPAPAVEG